jgi:hypothetical protein
MKGLLRVTHSNKTEITLRDFDAEEWVSRWLHYGNVQVLRLEHIYDPESKSSFDWMEFSTPVSVEYIYEEA